MAQVWISAIAGLAGDGKNKKIHQEEELFLKSFQENMIKSEENARRSGLKRRKTGPFYFADFSPFQFAGDMLESNRPGIAV